MQKLTTDVAKQYILHGEAEALRGVLKSVSLIEDSFIDQDDEEDIQELRYEYNNLSVEVETLYSAIEARLNKIEELVKNGG